MRSRVAALISVLPANARETVEGDTPAARATPARPALGWTGDAFVFVALDSAS